MLALTAPVELELTFPDVVRDRPWEAGPVVNRSKGREGRNPRENIFAFGAGFFPSRRYVSGH